MLLEPTSADKAPRPRPTPGTTAPAAARGRGTPQVARAAPRVSFLRVLTAATAALLALLATQPDAAPALEPPAGDPLVELSAALARLDASQVVRAQVTHRHSFTQGDDPPRPEGVVRATASAGPEGLQVAWDRAVLAAAEREEQALLATPDAPSPVRDALLDLRILALAHLLDPAPELTRLLRGATLREARDEVKDGVPARLLVLTVTPPIGARDRKYVKELTATARLWLGPDGLPLAAEQEIKAKGRVFLVVGFELEQREQVRFGRQGGRLVTLHRETEQRTSGAGDKGWRRSVTDLVPTP